MIDYGSQTLTGALNVQGGAVVSSPALGSVGLAVRGFTGQTANIQEWQDPTGATAMAYVDSSGRAFHPTLFTQSVKDPTTLQSAINLVTAGYAFDFTSGSGSAARVLMRLKETASQTGDALQLQSSTGTTYTRLLPGGNLLTQGLSTYPVPLAAPSITSGVVSGAVGSTFYTYRVAAVNGAGISALSTEYTVTNGPAPLTSSNFITVNWTAVTGATSYNVYGRTANIEAFLGSTTGTSFVDNTLSGPAAAPGINGLTNSSLNLVSTNWVQTQTTIARDTTILPPFPGVTAGLVTSTAASGGVNVQLPGTLTNSLKQYVACTPSTTYTASCWVLLGTAPQATVGFQWFDAAGTYISGVSGTGTTGTLSTAGVWTRLTATTTVPATAFMLNFYLGLTVSAVGQTVWVAAPQIDVGNAALPYQLDMPLPTGGIFEGRNRVYSAANPPPSSGGATFATVVKYGALA